MKNKNNLIYLLIGVAIGFIAAYIIISITSNNSTDVILSKEVTEEKESGKGHNEKMVSLTNEELNELGIIINEVEPGNIQLHSDLTGEIVPDPTKLAHIVPRFGGIVKNVFKKIGDRVQEDDVLAIIESNESLVKYEVKSSISGIVLDLHMTPGELIGDDKHVVTIANLSSVWAELIVYQKDLKKIKLGQNVEVYFDEIDNAVSSKIFYLSPTVDEHTRTATARVRLNNKNGYWKPGMFVTAKVLTDHINVEKTVTLNAIQNFNGQQVVFVKEGEGFRPRPITIGRTNTKYAEVLTGLIAGQTYVAQGAFVIKSELLKESFGGDHD